MTLLFFLGAPGFFFFGKQLELCAERDGDDQFLMKAAVRLEFEAGRELSRENIIFCASVSNRYPVKYFQPYGIRCGMVCITYFVAINSFTWPIRVGA